MGAGNTSLLLRMKQFEKLQERSFSAFLNKNMKEHVENTKIIVSAIQQQFTQILEYYYPVKNSSPSSDKHPAVPNLSAEKLIQKNNNKDQHTPRMDEEIHSKLAQKVNNKIKQEYFNSDYAQKYINQEHFQMNNYFTNESQENQDGIEYESISDDDLQPEVRSIDYTKTKLIEKDKKVVKKRNRRPFYENIVKVSEEEIKIIQIYSLKKTFKRIRCDCPFLKAIHIFDHKFATRTALKQLLTQFPTLEILTINCWVELKALEDLTTSRLKLLKTFCPRWDNTKFYSEYMNQQYFSTKPSHHKKMKYPQNLTSILNYNYKLIIDIYNNQ